MASSQLRAFNPVGLWTGCLQVTGGEEVEAALTDSPAHFAISFDGGGGVGCFFFVAADDLGAGNFA
jgi:hypothetical protein